MAGDLGPRQPLERKRALLALLRQVTPLLLAALALPGGLAIIVAGLIVALSGSKLQVVGHNAAGPVDYAAGAHQGPLPCQPGGTLPAGTTALRLPFGTNIGPDVSVSIRAGSGEGRLISSGHLPAGWGISETATVPVSPLARAVSEVRVCVTLGATLEPLEVRASQMNERIGGALVRMPVMPILYLRHSGGSWLGRLPGIVRRMGLAGAIGGGWVALLAAAIMAAALLVGLRSLRAELGIAPLGWRLPGGLGRRARGALGRLGKPLPRRRRPGSNARGGAPGALRRGAPAQALRALLRYRLRLPAPARACALVAFLNALCWSLISPPFQVPDEPSHFAYSQLLAEAGRLPQADTLDWSEEERVALRYSNQRYVRFSAEHEPIESRGERLELLAQIDGPRSRIGQGGAGVAAAEPPTYYAYEAIPYLLGSGANILDRLALMRACSAIFAALSALFAYLFLRELLPRSRWAWTVGALCVAYSPLLGLMSGAVNPDPALYAVGSASLFALARAFRRGLSMRRALALGGLLLAGFATKLNFLGLAPALLLALPICAWRSAGSQPRRALAALGAGLSLALAPALLYLLARLIAGSPVLGPFAAVLHPTGGSGSLAREASYIWQFYFPRLPGMHTYFPGILPWRQIWFNRAVGLYGWLDTSFPLWVDDLALAGVTVLAVLALRKLIAARRLLRGRLPELAVYALAVAGVLTLTGAASYQEIGKRAGGYGEPRYLLPLVAFLGLFAALAAKGAARRLERAAGVLIVVGALGWDFFSQLLTISRFYG